MPASSPHDLRLVFAGTPEFAAAHLEHLLREKHMVVGAYSQPDRPSGRGKKLSPSPVKALALARGLPVFQPTGFDREALDSLAGLRPDLMIVVAYGLLLPQAVLSLPRYGCVNVHASLLPRWRGAAPIERAILAGDTETGVSFMQMDAGLDTGPVLGSASTEITAQDDAETLGARLITLGCAGLSRVLGQIAAGTARAVPQDSSRATYAAKLRKEEAGLHWAAAARDIHNRIRALYPRSPAWCLHQGRRLRLSASRVLADSASAQPPGTVLAITDGELHIACGAGAVAVAQVQLEGRARMTVRELLNGHPGFFLPGTVLLSAPDASPQ